MKADKHVWILEDDPGAQFVYEETLGLRYSLRIFGTLRDFKHGLQQTEGPRPDLVVADVRLPDGVFVNFIQNPEMKELLTCPFIVVSSVDDLDALRVFFDQGASDYITKPFGKGELIVKIERLLSGTGSSFQGSPEDLTVDASALTICRGKLRSHPLTQKEFQLFNILNSAEGQSAPREEIIQRIWGNIKVGSKTLDVHLLNLRKKLSPLQLEILHIAPESYQLKLKKTG